MVFDASRTIDKEAQVYDRFANCNDNKSYNTVVIYKATVIVSIKETRPMAVFGKISKQCLTQGQDVPSF